MIFKTFDSKIDKWTSKIGIFGKSFNELGTAVNNAFKSVIDNLDNFDKDVGFWESLKNNLFAKKEDIKSQLVDVMPEIEANNISDVTKEIKDMASSVSENKSTWQNWFDILPEGKKHLAQLGQQLEGQIITEEGVIQANQQARDAAIAHNQEIKNMALGAKAAAAGMEILKTACNMIAFMFIAEGIQLAIEWINNLNNSFEKAKERIDNLSQTYQENKNELEDINKILEENKQRIQEILALEKPSYVDQKELKNLEREVELLERRKEILQHSQDATAKEAVEEIYNDFINRHDTNDEKREKAAKMDGLDFLTIGIKQWVENIEVENEATDREIVKGITDKYDVLFALREKLLNSGNNTIEFLSIDDSTLEALGLEDDSSIGDIDKRLDSLRSNLENYYADISEAILKINEFDPNLELEKSQDLIRRQDNLYKYINYDEWVKSTVKRIATNNNFSDIMNTLPNQVMNGLTDEDLLKQSETDEHINHLLKAISTNLYGKADEESKKKATSYLVDYLKEGIISEDGTVYNHTSFEQTFNSQDFKDSKAKLLDLATSGELSADTISSTEEYKKLIDQTGLSAEQLVEKIKLLNKSHILYMVFAE